MALAPAEDIAAMQATFGIFKENLQANMVVFYQKLLGEHPQYRHMFPMLDGVDVSEFPNNHYVRDIQGPKTGAAIAKIMMSLDDKEKLLGVINRLVNMPKHTKWHLTIDQYKSGFHSVMSAMKAVLGDRFTEEDLAIWKRFSVNMMQIVDEEIQKQKASQEAAASGN